MKTYSIKASEINKIWHIVDAKDRTLGRLASSVSQILKGKHKPTYTPHMDMGDFVIIINAAKIRISGNKDKQKQYFSHSGYPGGTKFVDFQSLKKNNPEKIIENAVKGMLPHNTLGRKMLKNLKIYSDSTHPHEAQKPILMEL